MYKKHNSPVPATQIVPCHWKRWITYVNVNVNLHKYIDLHEFEKFYGLPWTN
jgi:hypothetical protein